MPALDAVDTLSDDAPVHQSPKKLDNKKTKEKPKVVAKPKSGEPGPKHKPKAKATKDKKESNASPKAKAAIKRPAASSDAKGVAKKPSTRDPDRVSVCKSRYKKDGVWSIKLAQKKVIRVPG